MTSIQVNHGDEAMDTTVNWLKAASAVFIGFGILVVFAALPATSGPTLLITNIVSWRFDGSQSLAMPETRLLCAILGGVLAGWGMLLWLISSQLFPREPGLARRLILWSVGTWFVIDSTGSIVAGAPTNALFNIPFLLAFLLPLTVFGNRKAVQ
jgi:hypothetical protein